MKVVTKIKKRIIREAKVKRIISTAMFSFLGVTSAFAAEAAVEAAKAQNGMSVWFFIGIVVAAMFAVALAAGLCGLGQGYALSKAVESIARQPEASDKIQVALITGLAFIESLTIYALVLALILFFANPFLKYIVQ
jgi:F-type H+-transporting ATPase subunit c